MMLGLFKYSFTLHSDLTVDSLAVRFSQSISPVPSFATAPLLSIRWPWQKPEKPYEGRVTSQGFEASRIINYQNSFLPRVQGRFEPLIQDHAVEGAAVHIKMTLHPWAMGFLVVWELLWVSMSFSMLIHTAFNGITFIFASMPLLVGGIAYLSFWIEVRRSRCDLLRIISSSSN